ncbi:MAG TPA: DUF4215 domain-containing protein [Enhygromyxa sp.]|nr:DUF4215 domain-containing protein [Enhygromyxa sp.]
MRNNMIACWLLGIGVGCGADDVVGHGTESTESESTESETRAESESESESESDSTDESDESDSSDETGPDEPFCGDGIVGEDEVCDDGNSIDWDECSNACTLPTCGDGLVQVGEGCDHGPDNGPGKLCNARCQPNICGDGDLGPGEGCDDGNRDDDDRCPSDCVLASCGNGIVDPGEDCEDGNDEPGDGCTTSCLFPTCGDGVVWLGHEQCDDGNALDTDACTTACELATCGDGVVQDGEECDDHNPLANDGCNQCVIQRVAQISMGGGFACALLDTAAVRCWGANQYGQLGYGNTQSIGDDELPWTAGDVDVGGPVVRVAAGDGHACALLEGGTIRCWGSNYHGQLGYVHTDNIGDDEVPSTAGNVDVGGTVVQLGVGTDRTCVVLDTGGVRCWGYGGSILGYGDTQNIGDDETPASVGDLDLGGPATRVSSRSWHSCALMVGGGLRCWGESYWGVLGYGNDEIIGDDESPASAGDVDVGPGSVVDIFTGDYSTCVILQGGELVCWGYYGALSYPHYPSDIGDDETPADVGPVIIDEPIEAVVFGHYHTCALLDSGVVRCWGSNDGGGLGHGEIFYSVDDPAEGVDVELGDLVDSIAGHAYGSCVITDNGGVRCWGYGDTGGLGYGNTEHIGDDEWPATAGYVQVFEP